MDAYKKFGQYDIHLIDVYNNRTMKSIRREDQNARGLLVQYDSLPGFFASVVLPQLFRIELTPSWLSKMESEANMYSKGGKVLRGKINPREERFSGDSLEKESRATSEIILWSKLILEPTYQSMLKSSLEGLKKLNKRVYVELRDKCSNAEGDRAGGEGTEASSWQWNVLSPLPSIQFEDAGHAEDVFVPWDPFATKHSSKPFEVLLSHFITIIIIINNNNNIL